MKNNLVLGIIPARAGSKGIPNKNLKSLATRPLLAYTIESAMLSGVIDRLILSTDSPEIARLGDSLGVEVPFLRPSDLAQDDTPMLPVIKHAISSLEKTQWYPKIIVLLQPTAPLRTPEHIKKAIYLLKTKNCQSVVSVVPVPNHYSPLYVMKIKNDRLINFLDEGKSIIRRQDVTPAYSRDGTVYVVRRDLIMNENTIYGENCYPLILSRKESINLDNWEDWEKAETLLSQKKDNNV